MYLFNMYPSPEHKHHAGEVMALSPYTESPGWHWAWQCHCSCLSPQSVFALLYLNLSPRSVGGCCPDHPDSIALWLLVGFGQGRGTSRSGSWRREKEGVLPPPRSHPAGSWSGCIYPGPQSMPGSSFLSPWFPKSKIFVIFFPLI